MITALNRCTILYTPNLMLLFMTTASTLSVFVERAYVIEPKMSYTASNDAASVLAINKWHLYNSFMVMQDYVTSKYRPTDLIAQPTVVTKVSDVFGILFKKIIQELKTYVLRFTDPKCSKKDIKLVISTFLRSLEKSISPADFIPILDGMKEVYRQALKDNNMRYYYTDAYFMYLSNYITQEIYETHGKNPKLLTIWRKIVRKTYIQTVFTDQQCLIISPDDYKSVCLEYNAPIQLIESKNIFDDIISLLKKPAEITSTYENSDDTDVMVGYCFSIDISSYLISYFTRKAKEINENPNFFTHKNSIITDIISHLQVRKDYRKMMNAVHLPENVGVMFTNQSVDDVAEMLIFTSINDDKIEKCWDIATAFLSTIKRYRRLSITAFTNVFKINNKKPIDPFIPYDLEDESSETETEIYSTKKTLMPFNVIVGESSFRIIYKNLVLCDKIHEMIDDEIISYFYFFQSNLTPIKIMKLSSICGFSEQDNDGPINTADESKISKITDVNADNAEEKSETLSKNETECDKIEDDIKPIHFSNPKKANEQPKPTPMRQDTETHSRGKKIKKRNEESTQRKNEDSKQPSENVNNKQVDRSILPSGAPNVSSKSGSTKSDCKMQRKKDKVPETVVETEISKAMHLNHKCNANITRGSKTNFAVSANKSSEETQNSNKIEDRASPPPETDIDQLGDYVKLFLKRHLQLQYRQSLIDPTKRDTEDAREARDNSEQSKKPQHDQRGLNPAKRDTNNAREASDNSEQSKKPQPNRRGLNPAKRGTNNAREAREYSEQSKKPQQNQSVIYVATQSLDGSGPPKRQRNRSKPDKAPQCTDQPINAEVKPRQSRRQQTNPSKIEEASQSIDKSTEATGKSKEGIRQQHNQTVTDVAHESTDKPTEATGKLEQSKGANPKAEKDRQLRQFAESKISSSQDSKMHK